MFLEASRLPEEVPLGCGIGGHAHIYESENASAANRLSSSAFDSLISVAKMLRLRQMLVITALDPLGATVGSTKYMATCYAWCRPLANVDEPTQNSPDKLQPSKLSYLINATRQVHNVIMAGNLGRKVFFAASSVLVNRFRQPNCTWIIPQQMSTA